MLQIRVFILDKIKPLFLQNMKSIRRMLNGRKMKFIKTENITRVKVEYL